MAALAKWRVVLLRTALGDLGFTRTREDQGQGLSDSRRRNSGYVARVMLPSLYTGEVSGVIGLALLPVIENDISGIKTTIQA